MRLLAISDLHLSHPPNRAAIGDLGWYPDDWLILAGDVGSSPDHLRLALDVVAPRFARVLWTPGNHDLWTTGNGSSIGRGDERYAELVAICRARGVTTPEDPYPEWPGDPGTVIVPMFLLYDYSFRPPDVPAERVTFIGNGAVTGARMALLSRTAWQRVAEVAEMMTYRDLSADGSFMDEYVGALFLPHTDSDRFPRAHAALGVG